MSRGRRWVLFLLLAVTTLLVRPVRQHARAGTVLGRLSSGASAAEVVVFASSEAGLRSRVYVPRNVSASTSGLVLVHGVHYRGIDEPRLVRFAEALSSSGIVVMTPEITELTAYRTGPSGADDVGRAAAQLSARLGGRQVGVLGLSFGGGLSLIAAADPRYAPSLAYVVAIGAHGDLGRVAQFFVTDQVRGPDGVDRALNAHGYGMLVFALQNASELFAAEDVPVAESALRAWLQEDRDRSKAIAEKLSAPGRAKLHHLLDDRDAVTRAELSALITRHAAALRAMSPSARVANLTVPAYLLHGEGDTVIPATETEWLAREMPKAALRDALVSPALGHVDVGQGPSVGDQAHLVHFMAEVLAAADAS